MGVGNQGWVVLVVCSDTHGTDDAELTGRTAAAVAEADCVVHAGDFTTGAVLDAFHDASARLHAVHGNADDAAVRDRLPAARTVTYEGVRFAVTHRRDGGATALSLFGRERGADAVVFGHSHRATVSEGPVTLLNPGSHADPRGGRATHAELTPVAGEDGVLAGEIRTVDGEVVESFTVEGA